MDNELFWSFIEQSARHADRDVEQQAGWLVEKLTQHSLRDIFEFQRHLLRHRRDAYDGRLLAAAAVIDDMDDDDFQDFRVWLVSRGKTTFEKCLANPDALADVVEPGDQVKAHEIARAAPNAYANVAGVDEFDLHFQSDSPQGRLKNPVPWQTPEGYADPVKLRVLFPRLWARFGARFEGEN